MSIRLAETGDIAELARLNLQVQQLHLEAEPRFFKESEVSDVERFFRDALADPDKQVLVAVGEDTVVGYLLAEVRNRQENPFQPPRTWLQIDQIGVDPAYRRRGYGRSLMAQVVSLAEEMGIAELQAGVWVFNEASLALFRAEGFRFAEVRLHRSLSAEG